MRLRSAVLCVLVPLSLAGAAAAGGRSAGASGAGTPLPGYWRYNTSFLFSDSTEMKCIGPADIDKVLRGPENRHYDCVYPVREVADGHARFKGACTNRKNGQRASVALTGTYSPTRFDFQGTVTADMGMLTLPLNASIVAERVAAACPAA